MNQFTQARRGPSDNACGRVAGTRPLKNTKQTLPAFGRPSMGLSILCVASIVFIVSGVTIGQLAGRYPAPANFMEIMGGLLLIGGLAMLGAGLEPIVRAVHL